MRDLMRDLMRYLSPLLNSRYARQAALKALRWGCAQAGAQRSLMLLGVLCLTSLSLPRVYAQPAGAAPAPGAAPEPGAAPAAARPLRFDLVSAFLVHEMHMMRKYFVGGLP